MAQSLRIGGRIAECRSKPFPTCTNMSPRGICNTNESFGALMHDYVHCIAGSSVSNNVLKNIVKYYAMTK